MVGGFLVKAVIVRFMTHNACGIFFSNYGEIFISKQRETHKLSRILFLIRVKDLFSNW